MTQNQDVERRRNIRNGIIGILDLWASEESQLDYKKNVPIADVPAELFCQWSDDYYNKDSPVIIQEFSTDEREALERFDKVINNISDQIPEELPSIEEFIKTKGWKKINQAAIEVLSKIKRPE